MLVKDTKGRVLTDVHGRPMTTKDRWHPLVVSFIKRVREDGGEIISPAIEEMNEMAWEGKFNDALYVYFAGARKAGKTYALIPNDGSGDLDVERDSVAMEWEKYRTLDEIVNDMPEMAFDPSNGGFNGVAKRNQATNIIPFSSDFLNTYWIKTRTSTNDTGLSSPIKGVNYVEFVAHNFTNNTSTVRTANISVTSNELLSTHLFVQKKDLRYVTVGFLDSLANNGFLATFDLDTGSFETDTSRGTGVLTGWFIQNLGNGNFWIGAKGTLPFNAGHFRIYQSSNPTLFFDSDGQNSNYYAGAMLHQGDFTQHIPTNGIIATRLADDIEDIAVPMAATEIRAFVDGVETVIDSNLPATWEFPENSKTKYVIIK